MNRIRSKVLVLVFLAAVLTLMMPGISPAQAEQGLEADQQSQLLKKCYALDLIFLIDQSNSMSGTATESANDKFNNRLEAYRLSVDWLAQNQFSLCPEANHRVGVISFGSDVEVDLELQPIPTDQDTWSSISKSIKEALRERQMGNTDHALAFAEARAMLDRNPITNDTVPRKTAIIMVTDGRPCVIGRACNAGPQMDYYLEMLSEQVAADFPFSDSLLNREASIREQIEIYGDFNQIPEEMVSMLMAENPIDEMRDFQASTYIYILALNDAYPYLDEVGSTFSEIARDHGGDLIDLANNISQIPLQFNEVLSRLAMIKIAKGSCGTLYIQPYLSALALNIYKNVEGVPIAISYGDPQAALYHLEEGQGDAQFFGMVEYEPYGSTNESYGFVLPKAGEWYIDAALSACEELHVVYQTFLPQYFEMLTPDHALPVYEGDQGEFNPQDPHYLDYRIQDATVFPGPAYMVLDPEYPLIMTVEIRKPDGSLAYTELGFQSADSTWVSSSPVPVDQVGSYNVAIVSALAPCVDPDECTPGSQFELFGEGVKVGEFTYQVNQVDHFLFQIDEPTEGSRLPIHGSIFEDRYAEQGIPVSVGLYDGSGAPLSYKDILGSVDQAEAAFEALLTIDGVQFGPIPLSVDPAQDNLLFGEFLLGDPTLKGEASIEIRLVGPYMFDRYFATNNDSSVSITRSDPLLRNMFFLAGSGVFILLVLAGLIIWYVYHRSRALKGYLEFTHSQSEARALQVSIAKKWDQNVIAIPPQVGFSKAEIINNDGKSGEIKISYKYQAKNEVVTLKVNQIKQMPGGIPYQVRYVGIENKPESISGAQQRQYDPYRKQQQSEKKNTRRFTQR